MGRPHGLGAAVVMNLGEAKKKYRDVIAAARSAASEDGLSEAAVSEAERRLKAVHKETMRDIDRLTTRRFLSVNSRRGLVTKLEWLHERAHDDLRRIATGQPPSDHPRPSRFER